MASPKKENIVDYVSMGWLWARIPWEEIKAWRPLQNQAENGPGPRRMARVRGEWPGSAENGPGPRRIQWEAIWIRMQLPGDFSVRLVEDLDVFAEATGIIIVRRFGISKSLEQTKKRQRWSWTNKIPP